MLMVVGVALLLVGVVAAAGPILQLDHEEYDFGVAVEGDVIEHAFLITNAGDEELVITEIYAGCGCTATSLSDTHLDPGDVRRILVELSTSGYGGLAITKSVTLSSNDPDRPQITIRLTGRVVPPTAYLLDAQDLSGSLVLLIDLRSSEAYADGHLLGAINLPASEVDAWIAYLPLDVRIVLYDEDGDVASALAENEILPNGYTNLNVLTGGFNEWTRRYGERMVVTIGFKLDVDIP